MRGDPRDNYRPDADEIEMEYDWREMEARERNEILEQEQSHESDTES
jgi:hypothetical protein